MPDVQLSPTVETRDFLTITETADRSRLAVKTLYNWISLGRLRTPRRCLSRRTQGCDSLAYTFEAAVMQEGRKWRGLKAITEGCSFLSSSLAFVAESISVSTIPRDDRRTGARTVKRD